MKETPKGLRTHIAILGRRNAGKSSLLNALCGQQASITSPVPGTTADPVEKTMELAPIGPVVLIDTAGLDDEGGLGEKRKARSLDILDRADIAILALDGGAWGQTETELLGLLRDREIPRVIVRNKADLGTPASPEEWLAANGIDPETPVADLSALEQTGLDGLREKLGALWQSGGDSPLLADLLPEHGLAILVAPLDGGAPKGRLILPQVQAIRDILDAHCLCVVVRPEELPLALDRARPDLVVCDSQAIREVAAATPEAIPLTTFSILMARQKGNLAAFAAGAAALATLAPGDVIAIQEACSHHPHEDDIGRVKIPRLLTKMAGGELRPVFLAGKEHAPYPANAKAVVHCGGCVITRANMARRQKKAAGLDLPMTNYGMAISLAQGVLERVLRPFPDAWRAFKQDGI